MINPKKETHVNALREKCNALSINPTPHALIVSIKLQRLYHYCNEETEQIYAISSSTRESSCIQDSLGTPTGLHRVAKKIGADAPPGMIFKGRVATGERFWETDPESRKTNFVTTRILWLEGLEDGHNRGESCDTFQRYIYIHGTNHEARIGSRQSHGCILMTNDDIIELYQRVPEGTLVLICER